MVVARFVVLFWITLVSAVSLATTNGPGTFSFEGQLKDGSGNPYTSSTTQVRFDVLNPAANCILFADERTLDLSTTGGYFSVNVGGSPVWGDDINRVFQNRYQITGRQADRVTACNFTGTSGNHRLLRIHVFNGTVWETLSPDQVITSTPNAANAESVQGYSLENIALVLPTTSAPTCTGVTTNMSYFDVTTRQMKFCNGAAWIPVSYNSVTGGSGVTITNPLPGVANVEITSGGIVNSMIGTGAVENSHLAADAVESANILDGTIVAADLATGAVTSAQILDLTITSNDLANGSVNSAKLNIPASAGQVLMWSGAAWVANTLAIVTAPQIGTWAVNGEKLALASVSNNHLVADAVTSNKITDGTVVAADIALLGISGDRLGLGSVSAGHLGNFGATPNQVLMWSGSAWVPSTYSTLLAPIFLNVSGDTMNGELAMAVTAAGANRIRNVAAPADSLDAVNKKYANLTLFGSTLSYEGLVPAPGQLPIWSTTGWIYVTGSTLGGSGSSGYVLQPGVGITLTTNGFAATGNTIGINVGTGANQIVQLDATSRLPAVSGELLTNVNAASAVNAVNAANWSGNTLATAGLADKQVLRWVSANNRWQNVSIQDEFIKQSGDTMTGVYQFVDNSGISFTTSAGFINLNSGSMSLGLSGQLTGGTLSRIDLMGGTVTGIAPPVGGSDAVNWSWATSAVSGLSGYYLKRNSDSMIGSLAVGGNFLVVGEAEASRIRAGSIGSSALPAFSFTADTTTGMFLSSNYVLGFSANGVTGMKLTTTSVDILQPVYMNNKQIKNLLSPTDSLDAVNKLYSDEYLFGQRMFAPGTTADIGQVPIWSSTGWIFALPVGSGSGGGFALTPGVGITLTNNGFASSGNTIGIDVGTGPYKIVQLDVSGRLPAVSGQLLTNVDATYVKGTTVSISTPLNGQVLRLNTAMNRWENSSLELDFMRKIGDTVTGYYTFLGASGLSLSPSGFINLNSGSMGLGFSGKLYGGTESRIDMMGGTVTGIAPPVSGSDAVNWSWATNTVSGLGAYYLKRTSDTIAGTFGATGNLNVFGDAQASRILAASGGTSALPAFSFTNDTDTGIYRVAANMLAFSAGGADSFRATAGALYIREYAGAGGIVAFEGPGADYSIQQVASGTGSLRFRDTTTATDFIDLGTVVGTPTINMYQYINMNGQKITNLPTPLVFSEAATKGYVDQRSPAGTISSAEAILGFGDNVFLSRTSGDNMTAYGHSALYSVSTGYSNNAFGNYSLYYLKSGKFNAAFGELALFNLTSGNYNIGLGYRTAYSLTSGTGNIAIGPEALFSSTLANDNLAIGLGSLKMLSNSSSSNNIAIGNSALLNHNNGVGGNIAIGPNALKNYASGAAGSATIAIGLNSATNTGLSGSQNVYIGNEVVKNISGAAGMNAIIGASVGNSLSNIDSSVVVGGFALYSATGQVAQNVLLGSSVGMNAKALQVGNVALGHQAMYSASNAGWNTLLGYRSGYNMSGNSNTFVGTGAGYGKKGDRNVFIGADSGAWFPAWMPSMTNDIFMLSSGTNMLMVGSFAMKGLIIPARVEIKEGTWDAELALTPLDKTKGSNLTFSQQTISGDQTFWAIKTGSSLSGADFTIERYPNSGTNNWLIFSERSTGKTLINRTDGAGPTFPQASVEVRGSVGVGAPIFMASSSDGIPLFQVSATSNDGGRIDLRCPNNYSTITAGGVQIGCMQTDEHNSGDYFAAVTTCASLGARLPTFQEWVIARTQVSTPGLVNATEGDYEWTSDISSSTQAIAYNGNFPTTIGEYGTGASFSYRCYFAVR